MSRSSQRKKGHLGDDRLPEAPYHGRLEWVHCQEVHDMGNRVEITGAGLYIAAGLGWLAYSLLWEQHPWIAGLFNGVFS